MKKRMDELIRETFVLDAPKLCCSVSEISVVLTKDEPYEGSFTLSSEDAARIRGMVCSDERRIKAVEAEIAGAPCVVSYTIDPFGLSCGDVITGNLIARTCIGEMKIPVKAVVKQSEGESEFDEVKALEHFTKLAQTKPNKAFRFFVSEEFTGILRGKYTPLRTLYKGLSQNPVTYQHMEEFLIAAGKKEPVHISVDKREVNSYRISSSLKDTIYIYKSTWGYCQIDVKISGDFIETPKLTVTSEDFIGKVYGFEFILNRDRLSYVPRFGKILLTTPYEEITVNIEASLESAVSLISGTYRKRMIAALLHQFMDLKLRRIDYRTWYENSCSLIEDLKEEREDGLTLFAESYLAYCNEDNNKAIELLWKVKEGSYKFENVWERAVYQYLSKCLNLLPAEKADIVPKLDAYYQRDPSNYIILALYMMEAGGSPYNLSFGMKELENAEERGCRSPFLYLRAYNTLEQSGETIKNLSPFMLRTLLFAQRKGILGKEMLKKAAFLSQMDTVYRPGLCRLLMKGYESVPETDILEAVCLYIAKDDPSSPRYYSWYKKAVEEGLKIPGLYEYYMITRPPEDLSAVPTSVRVYFQYNQHLNDEKKAHLYRLIIHNKKEDPASYKSFKIEMEGFAREALSEGKINEDLSVLYTNFILPKKDLETMSLLARVAFTYRFVCRDPNIRSVIVCHSSLKDESRYELVSGKAYPNIYGPDARILLEDGKKRRFAQTIPYELEPLMDVRKTARACIDLGVWDTGLQLYCCHERGWQMDVNSRTVLNFLMAAENPLFTRKHRDMLRGKLLVYFAKNTDDPYAGKFAEKIKEGTYGWVDKYRTFDLLYEFAMYKKALALTEKFGFENLDPDKLLKIASERTYSKNYEPSEVLTDLCLYLFRRDKYTKKTLEYLARNFDGELEQMIRIWQQAQRGDAGCEKLEERILIASMFTRSVFDCSEEILEDYAAGGANAAVMRAFLTFLGEYYLCENRPISESTAARLAAMCNLQDGHMTILVLSWLKYLSGQNKVPKEELPRVRRLMKTCSEKGCRFTFLQNLACIAGDQIDIRNRTIIEERFPCGSSIVIHYRTDEGEYRVEPMKERIKGLYSKEFLLFCCEQLEYYFTVRNGEETYDTQVCVLKPKVSGTEGMTRYDIINRMVEALCKGNESEAEKAAKEYLKQEVCAERFFEIIA